MIRFVLRRLLFIAFILVLIIYFVFLGIEMASNSEATQPDYDLLTNGTAAWQETERYLQHLVNGEIDTFDVAGISVSALELLRVSYVNSMGLLLVALLLAAVVGIYAGSVAAVTKRKRLVTPLLTLTILGIATPSFFAGLLLQQGALTSADLLGRRFVSMSGLGWDFRHMLLPVLVLAARPLAYLTRAAYIELGHIMETDYIRTAFSKGLNRRQAVVSHAMRNMAVPILTAVGVSLRFALASLPIVEYFFNWPGIGYRLLEAINERQAVVVVTLASALGLTFLLLNLLLDVGYRLIDPRLREG